MTNDGCLLVASYLRDLRDAEHNRMIVHVMRKLRLILARQVESDNLFGDI